MQRKIINFSAVASDVLAVNKGEMEHLAVHRYYTAL
jgi:hypothetical protein